MRSQPDVRLAVSFLLCCALGSCAGPDETAALLPVTTSSDEARALYETGCELRDRLRNTDSRRYFLDAVEADPAFALAHLELAVTSPTTSGYFESLERAKALLDQVSEGERHLILATEAGAKGDPEAQLAHLQSVVDAYPRDAWVRNTIGNFFLNRQEYEKAIAHYEQAVALEPRLTQPFNGLGYAHRHLENYVEAEQAFLKYIDLIPGEPNPHDSYADLLMKTGRFEESIENYERALSYNPNFMLSLVGMGNNYMFLEQPDEARRWFRRLMEVARNDAERRQGLLWTAASYVHEGELERALESLGEMHAIAERGRDGAAMSADLVLMGDVRLRLGRPAEALRLYEDAVSAMELAEVPEELKETVRRNHLYRAARVALAEQSVENAARLAREFGEQVARRRIPAEIRLHHELLGRLAMAGGDHELALGELEQANQRDPVVLFLIARAWSDAGDAEKAREACRRAANFNGLDFKYGFVRAAARRMLEETE